MTTTPKLIEDLAEHATPVRRLAPPLVRACLWLSVFLIISGAAVVLFADFGTVVHRLVQPAFAIKFAATIMTGIGAVVAAFMLSVPDRSRIWTLLPILPLVIWLAASGTQCLQELSLLGSAGWAKDATPVCLYFVLGVGAPALASLLIVLRRARPLQPVLVALLGALGAGALAAVTLQFFHPFDVTFMDLGFHLLAVVLLLGVAALGARLKVLSGSAQVFAD